MQSILIIYKPSCYGCCVCWSGYKSQLTRTAHAHPHRPTYQCWHIQQSQRWWSRIVIYFITHSIVILTRYSRHTLTFPYHSTFSAKIIFFYDITIQTDTWEYHKQSIRLAIIKNRIIIRRYRYVIPHTCSHFTFNKTRSSLMCAP